MGRTTLDPIDNTVVGSDGQIVRIGTNQIGRYAIHFHHTFGPKTDAGRRPSVHAHRQRGQRAGQMGHHRPQQPLRPGAGQHRLRRPRRGDRDRGRHRELQRVRPQLRRARRGRRRSRAARRLRRIRAGPGQRRIRLLVPGAEQLHPQQRRRQCRELRLQSGRPAARHRPHPVVSKRRHQPDRRDEADRRDGRARCSSSRTTKPTARCRTASSAAGTASSRISAPGTSRATD